MSRETWASIDGKIICKSRDGVTTDEYASLTAGRAKASPFAGYGSDSLPGGVNGIINHADGKRYDSKSRYNQAVVSSGCRIVGNDLNNVRYRTPLEKGVRGDFNVKPALKEAVQKVRGC